MTRSDRRFALIPVADQIVFPYYVQQIDCSDFPGSLSQSDHCVICLSKAKDSPDLSDLGLDDVYRVGTLVEIVQVTESEMGFRILVEGARRVLLQTISIEDHIPYVTVRNIGDVIGSQAQSTRLATQVKRTFEEYLSAVGEVPPETLGLAMDVENPSAVSDLVAAYLKVPAIEKQAILEEPLVERRLEKLDRLLQDQIIDAQLDHNIDSILQDRVDRERREMLLKAKLRALQAELNLNVREVEIADYLRRLDAIDFSEETRAELRKEIQKLETFGDDGAELGLTKNYLDFVFGLPWGRHTSSNHPLSTVRKVLSDRHYGLHHVKERILETLAVKKMSGKTRGQILCLAGPPGVGKTSIVRSVASALGRPFCRVSLGGIRDEADIRGHRRTYVGALPGRIASAVFKAQAMNPVILLDEVDKMADGFRGDPAAVLLELLDPEQNDSFVDHYLQIPIDLSEVLFVCTANDLSSIPDPLLNRLEILRISGYSVSEKIDLALDYLLPQEWQRHGLSPLPFSRKDLEFLIVNYTADVGLRELDRSIQSILRKLVLKRATGKPVPKQISQSDIRMLLGPGIPKPNFFAEPQIGRSVALYSLGMTGHVLPVEAALLPGSGREIATGNVDSLVQETISVAIAFIKKNGPTLGIRKSDLSLTDVHLHFYRPDLPKKGEGWGLAVFAAILSACLEIPLPATAAFAGQISLLGKVLPVPDLEQMLLAASQLGMDTVVVSASAFEGQKIDIPKQLKIKKIATLWDLLPWINGRR